MNNTKLDKSAVCTAFACAVAAFVCGFAFCLALLSSAGSCYLLVKDFLFSTRGYVWFQQLKMFAGHKVFEGAVLVVLLLVLLSALFALIRFIFYRKGENGSFVSLKKEPVSEPVLPRAPSAAAFVSEAEVAEALDKCRRHPDEDSWRRLNALEPELLARYLKNEYPQVASVVLLRLNPKLGAEVLSLLPASFASETVSAMLNSRPVDAGLAGTIGKAVAENIENAKENDAVLQVGKILGYMDGKTQQRIMSALREEPSVLAGLKENTVNFEDFILLNPSELEEVLQQTGEPKLVIALRGASEKLRSHVYSSLPVKQAKILRETLAQIGPIRLRDIEKAQSELVSVCKNMYGDALRSRK